MNLQPGHVGKSGPCLGRYVVSILQEGEEPNPMAPTGVSLPIGLTNHGEVQPLGLLPWYVLGCIKKGYLYVYGCVEL